MRNKLLLLLFVALVALVPLKAAAQPSPYPGNWYAGQDNYNQPWSSVITADGKTYFSPNSGSPLEWDGTWRTEAYYLGKTQYPICSTFGPGSSGGNLGGTLACYAVSYDLWSWGGSRVQIGSYGCATAKSKHFNIAAGGGWNEVTDLYGTSCGPNIPDPPPDQGYCVWDEYYEEWLCDSPIILPLADKKALKRENYKLTGAKDGVFFDLDGDGRAELTAWTARSSHLAFLALDRNGNGRIDDGRELFGNHTLAGANNGFAALIQTARNLNANPGIISEGNPLYEKLLLWEDENHDGISQPEEIHKFSDEYLAIAGAYEVDQLTDKWGNRFYLKGNATVRDPGKGKRYPDDRKEELGLIIDVWDVFFAKR